MRSKSLLVGLAAFGLVTAPVAAQARETAGLVSAVSGETFVARGGTLLPATPSMQLYKGDRVITRADGSAKLAMAGGCDVAVGASAMTSVSSCADTKSADFSRAGYAGNSSALAGHSGGGFIVAILAAAAVIVGIVIVATTDDSPDSP